MSKQFSLVYLTAPGCSPPETIYLAKRAGFDFVSLRTIPMRLPNEPALALARDKQLLTATKQLLSRTDPRSSMILTTMRGKPWTSDGFRSSWSKACDKAGIIGLTFHDLRGSAVVRLALADATVPQIATFTGHSLRDVEGILDAHYLGRDVELAEIAVMKLETRTKL